jgi:hypothetical protein
MKQTAVEWLVEYIHSAEYQMAFGVNYISPVVVDKALEMEKEQMFKALVKGVDVHRAYDIELEFNEYYNETFKSE